VSRVYGAAVLFRIEVGENQRRYEIQIIVIGAGTDEEAETRANDYATAARHTYTNDEGQTVNWCAEEVLFVTEAPSDRVDLEHGTEVFSWPLQEIDLEAARRMIRGT